MALQRKTYPKPTDSLSGPPDLLIVNLVELFLQVLAIRLAPVEVQRASGL